MEQGQETSQDAGAFRCQNNAVQAAEKDVSVLQEKHIELTMVVNNMDLTWLLRDLWIHLI